MAQGKLLFRTTCSIMFSRSLRFVRSYHSSLPFAITREVKDALERKGPIVALESTIVSHGKFEKPLDLELHLDDAFYCAHT